MTRRADRRMHTQTDGLAEAMTDCTHRQKDWRQDEQTTECTYRRMGGTTKLWWTAHTDRSHLIRRADRGMHTQTDGPAEATHRRTDGWNNEPMTECTHGKMDHCQDEETAECTHGRIDRRELRTDGRMGDWANRWQNIHMDRWTSEVTRSQQRGASNKEPATRSQLRCGSN